MPVPQITITPAGFAALVNDEHTGTKVAKTTHIGLTATHFDVNAVGAVLPGEHKRLTTFGGKAVAADTLHLNIRDDGPDTYTLRGFGLYLQDGTLFAVYSQAAPIMEKAAAATLLLATDIRFSKITATSIEAGDVDFINPPATTAQVGVVRLSTDQEADAGSDPTTAITPRGLSRYINARFGADAPSAFVKTLLSAATAAIFRTTLGIKAAALRDEGHGNGLNADLLDGVHGDHYLDFRNSTNLPTSWSPSYHTHPISQVDGLAAALQEKANLSGASFVGDVSAPKITARGNHFYGGQTYAVLNPSAAGGVCMLRPDGVASTVGELVVATSAITWNGQGLWHTGTFDPTKKADLSGATFSGSVATTGVVGVDVIRSKSRLLIRDNEAGNVTIDAVNAGNTEFAHLMFRGTAMLFNGYAVYHEGSFNPSTKANIAGDTFQGNVGARGEIKSIGERASLWFEDRSASRDFTWYANGGIARLATGERGGATSDLITVTAAGVVSLQGLRLLPAGGEGGEITLIGSEGHSNTLIDSAGSSFRVFGGASAPLDWNRENGNLNVPGALAAGGGFDWGSSRKLKEIDGPMPYGLAEVRRISTLIGRYKPEYNNDGRTRLFFDAEQFADVMPEAVNLEGVEFQGKRVPSMKLDQVLPPAYRAIAQLADLVDQLRAEIKTLKEAT